MTEDFYHVRTVKSNWSGYMEFFNEENTPSTNLTTRKILPISKKTKFRGVLVEILNKFKSATEENINFIEFFDNSSFYLKIEGANLKMVPTISHLEIHGTKFWDKYIGKSSDEYLGKFCHYPFLVDPGQGINIGLDLGSHKIKENLIVKVSLVHYKDTYSYNNLKRKCNCLISTLWAKGCSCGGS